MDVLHLVRRGLIASAGAEARALFPAAKACALFTDSKVGPLHAETVTASLTAAGFTVTTITVPAGEPAKCFAEVESINRQMISAGLDRQCKFNEGFAEIIKHPAIRDAAKLPAIAAAATQPRRELSDLIARNAAIKAAIVTEDELETKGLHAETFTAKSAATGEN